MADITVMNKQEQEQEINTGAGPAIVADRNNH